MTTYSDTETTTNTRPAPAHFKSRAAVSAVTIPNVVRKLVPLLIVAGIVLMTLFLLLPTLHSGYNGDDARNSEIPMIMKAQHQSYMNLVVQNAQNWARSSGRFFPLSMAETAGVFLIFTTRLAYKYYQLGVVLFDLALLGIAVGVVTKNRSAGLLAAFLAVLTFQLRQFFDPIMLFSGQQQIIVGLILAAFVLTWTGSERRSTWRLLAATALWIVAMLTYETTYLLLPLFLLVVLFVGGDRRIRILGSALLTVPAVALFGLVEYLRSQLTATPPSYTVNLTPHAVTHTFVNQFTSVLPLSYPTLFPAAGATTWSVGNKAVAAALAVGAVAILYLILRDLKVSRKSGLLLGTFGLGMWILPSAIVAVTQGRQSQVQPGAGYVSEYVGYFGFAIVATVLIAAVASYKKHMPKFVIAMLIVLMGAGSGTAMAITRSNNIKTVDSWDPYRYPREVFERGVQNGDFVAVPPGAHVISLQPGIWVDPSVIQWYGGPKVTKLDPPYKNSSLPNCGRYDETCFGMYGPQWLTNHTGDANGNGLAETAQIMGAIPNSTDRPVFLSNNVFLYIESPALKANPNAEIAVSVQAQGKKDQLSAVQLHNSDFNVLNHGDGWTLLQTTNKQLIGADRMTVTVNGTDVGSLAPW